MKTYTLQAGRALAEIVPERGGLITRFAVDGEEVLYLDRTTLDDPTKNVRGGIPILFPWAGRPPGAATQHGFARQLPFAVTAQTSSHLQMQLLSGVHTRVPFPHDFALTLTVTVQPASLELRIEIHNTGSSPMPVHFGLHPYFRVPLDAKPGAAVTTGAQRAYDNTTKSHRPFTTPDFGTGETDLHLLDHAARATTLTAPGLRPRHLAWDDFLPVLVLWTQPDKEFICVEPWSALAGDYDQAPMLAPGGRQGGLFRVSLPS